jgi:hypothetical protein
MEEDEFKTSTELEAGSTPIYLGPCDTFSIPPRAGCQALTVIQSTPAGEMVVGMRREFSPTGGTQASGPAAGVAAPRKLYKRHYAAWIN